jgi:hypothetical protein
MATDSDRCPPSPQRAAPAAAPAGRILARMDSHRRGSSDRGREQATACLTDERVPAGQRGTLMLERISPLWPGPLEACRMVFLSRWPDHLMANAGRSSPARKLTPGHDHHGRRPGPEDPPAPLVRRAQSNGISLRYQRSPYWPDILIPPPIYSGAFFASSRRTTLVVRPAASAAETSTTFTKCKNRSNASRRRLRILRSTAACPAIVVPSEIRSTYPLATPNDAFNAVFKLLRQRPSLAIGRLDRRSITRPRP